VHNQEPLIQLGDEAPRQSKRILTHAGVVNLHELHTTEGSGVLVLDTTLNPKLLHLEGVSQLRETMAR